MVITGMELIQAPRDPVWILETSYRCIVYIVVFILWCLNL